MISDTWLRLSSEVGQNLMSSILKTLLFMCWSKTRFGLPIEIKYHWVETLRSFLEIYLGS